MRKRLKYILLPTILLIITSLVFIRYSNIRLISKIYLYEIIMIYHDSIGNKDKIKEMSKRIYMNYGLLFSRTGKLKYLDKALYKCNEYNDIYNDCNSIYDSLLLCYQRNSSLIECSDEESKYIICSEKT